MTEMNATIHTLVCAVALCFSITVQAAQVPKCGVAAGMEASSVCTLSFSNNRNVYLLPEFYPGYQMHIYFEKDERILRYTPGIGNKSAWEVKTKPIIMGDTPDPLEGANRLGLKMIAPLGVNPQTNLTITTVKGNGEREYVFLLRARDNNMRSVMDEAPRRAVHVVHFTYPTETVVADQKDMHGTRSATGCKEIKQRYPNANYRYETQGDASPYPLCFWDDGQNTFALLADQSGRPAVWSVDIKETPSLGTSSFRPPIVHIVGVHKRVVLNFNGAVAAFERIDALPLTVTYR